MPATHEVQKKRELLWAHAVGEGSQGRGWQIRSPGAEGRKERSDSIDQMKPVASEAFRACLGMSDDA